jgi:hypothetical protein
MNGLQVVLSKLQRFASPPTSALNASALPPKERLLCRRKSGAYLKRLGCPPCSRRLSPESIWKAVPSSKLHTRFKGGLPQATMMESLVLFAPDYSNFLDPDAMDDSLYEFVRQFRDEINGGADEKKALKALNARLATADNSFQAGDEWFMKEQRYDAAEDKWITPPDSIVPEKVLKEFGCAYKYDKKIDCYVVEKEKKV